jgi:hypothetical protein
MTTKCQRSQAESRHGCRTVGRRSSRWSRIRTIRGLATDRQEVAAIKPDRELLLAHHDAVFARTNKYLEAISPQDLDRIIDRQWDPTVSVGARIVSVINDNTKHAGQAAYVRGLIEKRRWYVI